MRFARLANAMGERYEHLIISLRGRFDAAELLQPDVRWRRVDIPPAGHLRSWRLARRILADNAVDLLVTYNWGAIEWAVANRWRPVCRHVHIEDGFGPEEVNTQLGRRVRFRRIALGGRHTVVVLPSQKLHAIASTVWKLPTAKLRLVPNGVDVERFARAREEAARIPSAAAGAMLIGTVAHLRPEKNVGRLVEAFALLRQRRNDCRLVIVGDGPERGRIEQLAGSAGVEGLVTFTGASAAPESHLATWAVYGVSSDTEQMPLGVLEAMAAGLPIASVDVGDIRHMVAPANRPYVVPAGDTAALAGAISALLDDGDLRQSIGAANLDRVRSTYSLEAMIAAYDRLFGEGSEGGSARR